MFIYAPVAQWIRASVFGTEGRGFESLPVYHLIHVRTPVPVGTGVFAFPAQPADCPERRENRVRRGAEAWLWQLVPGGLVFIHGDCQLHEQGAQEQLSDPWTGLLVRMGGVRHQTERDVERLQQIGDFEIGAALQAFDGGGASVSFVSSICPCRLPRTRIRC